MRKEVTPEYLLSMHRKNDQISFWQDFLKNKKNKPVSFLELGSGNGDTLKSIFPLLKKEDSLFCLDVDQLIVEKSSKIIGDKAIMGNICSMSFENDSFDAINASSILHEVSTYGYEKDNIIVNGLEAIKVSIKEIKRVLREGGVMFYRDVLAPYERLDVERVYTEKSVVFFLDLFLDNFLKSEPNLYEKKLVERNTDGYRITAENFLHREIQKHFLLCIENISQFLSSYITKNKFFEDKYQKIMYLGTIFSQMAEEGNIELTSEVLRWIRREGSEKYLYFTVNELLSVCNQELDNDGFVLLPINHSSEYRRIRIKKGEVLAHFFDKPEEEGVQMVVFKKVKIDLKWAIEGS